MTQAPAQPPVPWLTPIAELPVNGRVLVPGSKSLMARALVLAAIADAPGQIVNPLRSRDSLLMVQALRALGTAVSTDEDRWQIMPGRVEGDVAIDCGLAGTVMRFVPPLAALSTGRMAFDGDPAARHRPIGVLLDGLRQAGVRIEDDGRGALPFRIDATGTVRGGEVSIDASASSQFVTGLLLCAAAFQDGIQVVHTGAGVPSRPHIEMTLATLRERGVDATVDSESRWSVCPGTVRGVTAAIEPDVSNSGPFLAAALVTSGTVSIAHWPTQSNQPAPRVVEILQAFGAHAEQQGDDLVVRGPQTLQAVDLDLQDVGELTPVVAAICLFADGPSRLRGVAHIRGHETDRLAALTREFTALGARVEELPDGLQITPAPLHGGSFRTYDDHRMAHAGAIVGLRVPDLHIDNLATTAKTMPQFGALWSSLVTGDAADVPTISELAR